MKITLDEIFDFTFDKEAKLYTPKYLNGPAILVPNSETDRIENLKKYFYIFPTKELCEKAAMLEGIEQRRNFLFAIQNNLKLLDVEEARQKFQENPNNSYRVQVKGFSESEIAKGKYRPVSLPYFSTKYIYFENLAEAQLCADWVTRLSSSKVRVSK